MRKLNTVVVLTYLAFSSVSMAGETTEPINQQEISNDNNANQSSQTSQQVAKVDLTTIENPAVKLCQIRGSRY